jgi:hypothetical protein
MSNVSDDDVMFFVALATGGRVQDMPMLLQAATRSTAG